MSTQANNAEPTFEVDEQKTVTPGSNVGLDAIVENTPAINPAPTTITGALIGVVEGFANQGQVLVSITELAQAAVSASCAVDPSELKAGNSVVVIFEKGDPARPIIIAKLFEAGPLADLELAESELAATESAEVALPILEDGNIQAQVDDERLVLKAKKEIQLKCGKASITLTESGKVIIRGAYISSRSSGVNRIKGGSVHLN